ncbi:MAG: phosphoribosylamine--glycine ligase [Deltaproteobacteria bacterium]|nr:MAG: phosphoribosylamine--glycine ligase [Deltaproteobacteria bacterium]
MRILLVGQGGREHALAWSLAKSPEVEQVWCVAGSDGMATENNVRCLPELNASPGPLVELARREGIDLVVVGPEQPLVEGLADSLQQAGIRTLGPVQAGARLEGSKVFAKRLMKRMGVPTADFEVFAEPAAAIEYLQAGDGRCVVKADGLAAGKGVFPCSSKAEAIEAVERIMVRRQFGSAGDRVVIESFLEGEEASCIALVDGRTVLPMASSQDHKRVFDQDRGPNTGGMGAYSPAPVLDDELQQQVRRQIMEPLMAGLAQEGVEYRGVLYAGLMITSSGPQVLEFNVRMGDPETQPLLMRLRSDLAQVLWACAEGRLSGVELQWDERPCVCVVMASGGYPGSYQKGKVIEGLPEAGRLEQVKVFHAGTRWQDGRFVTNGGRVLNVCALGADIRQARDQAYRAVEQIHFENAHWRRDIAARALERLS